MAVVGALNQLVSGLHSGLNAGFEYGERGLSAYSQRKMGEAEAELDKYMSYDPTTGGGAIDTGDGAEAPPTPTLRDLFALRQEYRAAARLSRDPDAIRRADERWATQLKEGADNYIDIAIQQMEAGNHAAATRALNHANGFLPNGMGTEAKTNDKGELVVKGFDQSTGMPVLERAMTKQDLLALKAYSNDPASHLQYLEGLSQQAYERRQATINAKRQAEQDAQKWAVDQSTIRKNTSQANLNDRMPVEGTPIGSRLANHRRQVMNDVRAATKEYLDGANLSANEIEAVGSFGARHAVQTLASFLAFQDTESGQDINPMDKASKAMQLFMKYDEARKSGDDPEFVKAIEQIIGQSSGIPVE